MVSLDSLGHWGFRSHPKTMLFIFPFKTEMIGSCILRVFFLVHSNFFLLKIASLCWSNPYMSWKNHKFQWINFHLLTLKSHFNKVIILRVQTPIVIIYHWYSASPKLPFPRAVALVGRRHALPPAPRAPWRRQGPAPGRNSCVFFWAQQVKHGANLEPHQYGHLQTEISSKTWLGGCGWH